MKKILLTIAITLSFLTGFTSVNTFAAVNTVNTVNTAETNAARICIKVYEDGAIWVYVYEEDGTYIGKYIDENF